MRKEVRAYPQVPRYIEDEAAAIAVSSKRKKVARKIAAMDPPSRAAAACTLAVQGASYPEIAHILDYRTPLEAKEVVWEAIAQLGADHDDVERMRTLMSHRLDRLLYAVMPASVDTTNPDQVTFGRFALAILDRQAKLYGLDAAAQVVVYTPTQKEIAQHAEQVTAIMRTAAGAIEADIIDAEVIEAVDADGASGAA